MKPVFTARITYTVLAAIVLCLPGCATSRFKSGQGDAGYFILLKAEKFGAVPTDTNAVSNLKGPWHFLEDQYGVVVRMPYSEYPALETFLKASFGAPQVGPKESKKVKGTTYGVYRLTPKGGGLQFSISKDTGAQVVIIGPMDTKAAGEAAVRVLQDEDSRKSLYETVPEPAPEPSK